MTQLKKVRIWELDAFRGVCILCVILVHGVFDLQYFAGWDLRLPSIFQFVMDYGGVLFVLLSGICVTLGSHSVRRGLLVFGCGLVITLVTLAMAALGMAGTDVIIQFGVLHLLGFSMMVYPLYKKLPTAAIAALGAAFVLLGYVFLSLRVAQPYWFALGLRTAGFASGDYFPIFPQLGWFMLGTVLGRTLYRQKRTLLPKVRPELPILRFFSFCGRQSLWIYLLHQPLVYGLITLLTN